MLREEMSNDSTGHGDIFDAVKSKDLRKLRAILKEHPQQLNAIDEETGRTPLNMAATKGFYSLCAELITRDNVDIYVEDWRGRDAMFNAHMTDRDDIVELISTRRKFVSSPPRPIPKIVSFPNPKL